jgi:Cu+-exporting ATPase
MTVTLHIDGMACERCAAHVEKALGSLPGVTAVKVDLATGTAVVEAEPGSVPGFAAALEAEGYALVSQE